MMTKLRLGLLGAVVLVALGAFSVSPVATCAAQGGSGCVPNFSQEPAAGSWRGNFSFDYKMTVPDTPAAFSLAWRGDVAIALTENRDEQARRRLGVDGTPVQRLSRDETPPVFAGRTDVTMAMNMVMSDPGLDLTQNAATKKAASLGAAAERDRDGKKLVSVALLGRPQQFQFAGAFTARDDSGVTTGEVNAVGGQGGSVRGTVEGDLRGIVNADLQNGQLDSHVDVVDRRGERRTADNSTQVGTVSQQRRPLFRLIVETKECGKIGGHVESDELMNEIRAGGMVFVPVRSEWHATLAERDEQLEQSAERYAKEPIPAMSSRDPEAAWTSWQRAWTEYFALRGADPSDYRLCALKPAHERIVEVTALALRALLDGTAKGDAAAKPRLGRLMSVIEGFGREAYLACPAVREAYERLFGASLPQASTSHHQPHG
ncbi:MAG TPA: hypothetical protein VGP97_05390 [Burkholderiales bacterium]|jgi:hypothetical protein|nr:hypothetical protein [Burkholderiales bacterium]